MGFIFRRARGLQKFKSPLSKGMHKISLDPSTSIEAVRKVLESAHLLIFERFLEKHGSWA